MRARGRLPSTARSARARCGCAARISESSPRHSSLYGSPRQYRRTALRCDAIRPRFKRHSAVARHDTTVPSTEICTEHADGCGESLRLTTQSDPTIDTGMCGANQRMLDRACRWPSSSNRSVCFRYPRVGAVTRRDGFADKTVCPARTVGDRDNHQPPDTITILTTGRTA
jgi:hypothetical protein